MHHQSYPKISVTLLCYHFNSFEEMELPKENFQTENKGLVKEKVLVIFA